MTLASRDPSQGGTSPDMALTIVVTTAGDQDICYRHCMMAGMQSAGESREASTSCRKVSRSDETPDDEASTASAESTLRIFSSRAAATCMRCTCQRILSCISA